ncbi:MAG: hypothetical protein LBU32_12605 [Clostridiales bacterium]|jgi:sporulation integral membrane protein YlbJ|nr:hypothetical protein [Clostridiales bacterium]
MNKYSNRAASALLVSALTILMIFLILAYPAEVISASSDGLLLWFNQVLPTLLPFMIGVNILSGVGFINFLGKLLSPVMEPLFGVPGEGGFALAAGMTSGYPMGAKITAMLRSENSLTKYQAQRLLSFCNNSGPLFILGAVGASMFKSERAGWFLIFVHYSSALIAGLIFRFYKRRERASRKPPSSAKLGVLSQAMISMNQAALKNGKPIGAVLAESVLGALETIGLIGGFIIFFNVLVRTFTILIPIGDPDARAIATGIIEITNGVNALSQNPGKMQLIASGALISFGGISIFFQTLSFIAKTDLSAGLYLLAKAIQSGLSVIIGLIAYPHFGIIFDESVYASSWAGYSFAYRLTHSTAGFVSMMGVLVCLGATIYSFRRLQTSR